MHHFESERRTRVCSQMLHDFGQCEPLFELGDRSARLLVLREGVVWEIVPGHVVFVGVTQHTFSFNGVAEVERRWVVFAVG